MKILGLYLALVAAWWLMILKLAQLGHLKTVLLLVALFAIQCPSVRAQGTDAPDGTPVGAAAVSGLDVNRLSPGLRRDIDALVGTQLNGSDVDALARRLEAEQPGSIVATRSVLVEDGRARVVFLVAVAEADHTDENVNARYVVESVSIEGIPEGRLSPALRDDLHAVVGTPLGHDDGERLLKRVRRELPGYDVTRRMSRGSERGRLRMTLNIRPGESMRWVHFEPAPSKLLYHSDEGWSGLLDLDIGSRDWRVSPIVAMSNADDLVEEYSGFGVRIEGRNTGTEALGVGIELTTFDATWRDETRAALLTAPYGASAYHTRSTVAPWLTFGVSPQFQISGGVSITQLEPDDNAPGPSQSANTYVISFAYQDTWRRGQTRHRVDTRFGVRAASGSLQSDLDYTRYFGQGEYRFEWGNSTLVASGLGGAVTGMPPLFERFTLGDTSTLRGWNKYDIAPAGGDRVGHGSIEYSHRGFAFFLDGGSAWNAHEPSTTRFSTGFGFHEENVFVTLGFPLNTPDVRAMFMIGARF